MASNVFPISHLRPCVFVGGGWGHQVGWGGLGRINHPPNPPVLTVLVPSARKKGMCEQDFLCTSILRVLIRIFLSLKIGLIIIKPVLAELKARRTPHSQFIFGQLAFTIVYFTRGSFASLPAPPPKPRGQIYVWWSLGFGRSIYPLPKD